MHLGWTWHESKLMIYESNISGIELCDCCITIIDTYIFLFHKVDRAFRNQSITCSYNTCVHIWLFYLKTAQCEYLAAFNASLKFNSLWIIIGNLFHQEFIIYLYYELLISWHSIIALPTYFLKILPKHKHLQYRKRCGYSYGHVPIAFSYSYSYVPIAVRSVYSSGSNPSNSPKTYLYTVSERHHYATQVNQTLPLGLGSGFIHGFSFTFML